MNWVGKVGIARCNGNLVGSFVALPLLTAFVITLLTLLADSRFTWQCPLNPSITALIRIASSGFYNSNIANERLS